MIDRLAHYLGRALETFLIFLMIALTTVVVLAVIFRKGVGASLVWYDEVAEVMLIWVTYYGAALAALRRRHIGFDGVLVAMPLRLRFACFLLAEALVIGFFLLLAYGGWLVMMVVAGDALISLRWVPLQFTHSVIPIGALLFVIAELLSAPRAWRLVGSGKSLEYVEIEETIEEVSKR